MKIINTHQVESQDWTSPKGKYGGSNKNLSTALGRDDKSTDLLKRHPFDVAITTLAPGQTYCPYHAHDAQWEFYHVTQGKGIVRDQEGETEVGPGDAFLFKPGEAHQLRNDSDEDFTYYVIADNPVSDHCYYPDSKKWMVEQPESQLVRSEPLDYFDGEE
ncbi:cupin domain-containing protein [Pelagicoccus mobilis]|uniref:Cupin domain-containing protein n=1 Tax=Pelagicoccus mobilis TaxID=415221 RepID=A0A934RYP1_9BACT|nr:cupin domain-containing protein [Pelagicoccus mobilis]MBK1876762.1 cupin domain-containing protein [Pelagicoccus mobilis]